MRQFVCFGMLMALLASGCSEPQSKMADKPTDEQIKAVQQADKSVEDEERGTPYVPGKTAPAKDAKKDDAKKDDMKKDDAKKDDAKKAGDKK
jgi:hypothetical protein